MPEMGGGVDISVAVYTRIYKSLYETFVCVVLKYI
jgi:hypothetical protein